MQGKIKNFTIVSFLSYILIVLPTPIHTQAQENLDLEATSKFELESSHWTPQRRIGDTVVVDFKNRTTLEDEYYNGSITFKNNGQNIINISSTIYIYFGQVIVSRNISISTWNNQDSYLIELNYIDVPSSIDWSNATVTFNWETKNEKQDKFYQSETVQMLRKGDTERELTSESQPIKEDIHEQDHIHPLQQQTITPNRYPISIQTHVGEILDIWEGSYSYGNLYYKGSGPSLSVKISFTQQASPGFYIDYTLESENHGWTSRYTFYWSGTYENTVITFTLNLGWTFSEGQYSFGQGNYKFTKAIAFNGWAALLIQSDNNNKFSIAPSPSNAVFLITIYDHYYTDSPNCLTTSPVNYYVNQATDRFEQEFVVTYYTYIKEQDWQTGVSSDNSYACWGTEKSTSAPWSDNWSTIGTIPYLARQGITNALGMSGGLWRLGDFTHSSNHGYDQALAMSGVFHADNHVIGKGDNLGNIGLVMPGWIDSYWNVFTAGYKYTQLIQHELSHNFGANHDDSPSWQMHVMRSSLAYSHTQWQSAATTTIGANINQFTNMP